MSYSRKQALRAATIWALIFGALLTVVLGTGISRFVAPEQSIMRLLAAAIILPGFLLNAWLGWRSRWARQHGELDERDDAVARNAALVTLLVVAIAVYLVSIFLYEAHSASGLVSVGWLYLLAYGTLCLVNLVFPVAALVIDLVGAADG